MRLGKARPAGEYEAMVAAILDLYAFDYRCQVWFYNPEPNEFDVNAFRADFVLVGLDLVIEVDDPRHGRWQERARDRIKDRIYRERGFKILRIPTEELDANVQAVAGLVISYAEHQEKARGW